MQEEKKEELKPSSDAPKDGQEELKKEDPNAPEGQVDYKAELEKIRQERDNYKEGMLKAKGKLKEKKEEDEDEEDNDEKINKLVDEKVNSLKVEFNSVTVDSLIDSISTNPDEKNLIKEHYENSIVKSGSSLDAIKRDLENAKLIANRSKIYNENKELKEALIFKNTVSSGMSGSNFDKEDGSPDPKLSPTEKTLFDRTNQRRINRGEKPLTVKEFVGNN
jgi:hypothetical protein